MNSKANKMGAFAWKRQGFTVIEILVSLAILALAAAAFVPVFSYVAQATQQNKYRMTATEIAASVVEDIRAMDYDAIGTAGGNPSGIVPQTQTITIGGVGYTVDTLITWTSAKGSDGMTENEALKSIRVIVSARNAFSGTVQKTEEIHSIVTREGEKSVDKAGRIRLQINKADGTGFNDSALSTNITGPVTQSMIADYAGTVLYGIIPAGKYSAKAQIPTNYIVSAGTKTVNGYAVNDDINVIDYKTEEVFFYIDKPQNFCHISVQLVEADGNTPAKVSGNVCLSCSLDGKNTVIPDNPAFSDTSLLSENVFGNLHPKGIYKIKITGVSGYLDYDMSGEGTEAPLLGDGSHWDGTFPSVGSTLALRVKLKKGSLLYSENSANDFREGSIKTYRMNQTTVYGEALGLKQNTLNVLTDVKNKYVNAEYYNSYWGEWDDSNSPHAQKASDGDPDTYWYSDNGETPQRLIWNLNESRKITGMKIHTQAGFSQGNRWNTRYYYPPKSISLKVYKNGSWLDVPLNASGEAVSIENKTGDTYFTFDEVESDQFALYIPFGYNFDPYITVNEVELLGSKGYYSSGYRISNPVTEASAFTSAPELIISWDSSDNSNVEISTAVLTARVAPKDSDFKVVANGARIPDTFGVNMTNRRLWIRETLKTNDPVKTPLLNWLKIMKMGN